MKRFAFHRVYGLPDGWSGIAVVELGEDGFYCSHYVLTEESPAVVWVGGAGVLLPQGIVPRAGDSIGLLLEAAAAQAHAGRLRLWSACGLPVDAGVRPGVTCWTPVF